MDPITEATKRVMPSTGCEVFQIFQFSEIERKHVITLLELSKLPENARVLDVGCGVGAVPKIMQSVRPDLKFSLLNDNEYQLSLCPEKMDKLLGDVHNVKLDPSSFDTIFCHYVLGYLNMPKVFKKFFDALKEGGELQIYDMTGFHPAMMHHLGYVTYPEEAVANRAKEAGFEIESLQTFDQLSTTNFQKVLELETDEAQAICRMILNQMKPVLWRFRKPSQSS